MSFFVKLTHHAFMTSTRRGVAVEIFFVEGGDEVGSGYKFAHFLWTS